MIHSAKLAALLAVCEGATQGERQIEPKWHDVQVKDGGRWRTLISDEAEGLTEHEAALIALLDPDTVRELVKGYEAIRPRRYGDEKPAEGERVLVWRGDAWGPAVHDGWGELSPLDEFWLPMPPEPEPAL